MVKNGQKWSKIVKNHQNSSKMVKIVKNGQKRSKMVKNDQKWSKMAFLGVFSKKGDHRSLFGDHRHCFWGFGGSNFRYKSEKSYTDHRYVFLEQWRWSPIYNTCHFFSDTKLIKFPLRRKVPNKIGCFNGIFGVLKCHMWGPPRLKWATLKSPRPPRLFKRGTFIEG